MALPEVAAPATEPGFTVSAVARRLGVAAATLRTWDRRYGLGPSQRTPGAHRRYTAQDIERLDRMRQLLDVGMPPGDAARAVLRTGDEPGVPTAVPQSGAGAAAGAAELNGWGSAPGQTGDAADSQDYRAALAQAADGLDTAEAAAVLRRCLQERGVVWTWDMVIVPVLQGIGERYRDTGAGVEVEHLLSNTVQAELFARAHVADSGPGPAPVVLAAADDEEHTPPLYALAAALAERRIPTRVLGARTPPTALRAAVQRLQPRAVFLWAQQSTDTQQVGELAERSGLALYGGGPGWPHDCPFDARPSDLTGAVCLIARTVGW